MKNYKKAITHGGNFHADDVFSTALLKILMPDIEVSREIKLPAGINESDDTIVYDIGGGKFDHHQHGSEIRPEDRNFSAADEVPYAAFGLLWREYGHVLVDEKGWSAIDEEIVFPIDAHDNGVDMTNSLSLIIKHMNPTWDSNKSINECFDEAVEFAKKILEREIEYHNSAAAAANFVNEKCFEGDPLLILDTFVPWQKAGAENGIRICVYPSNRGGWCIQTIDSTEFPLPEEWLDEENDGTLPEGMTFCHKNRFLAATKTKEDAINYAREAIAAMES